MGESSILYSSLRRLRARLVPLVLAALVPACSDLAVVAGPSIPEGPVEFDTLLRIGPASLEGSGLRFPSAIAGDEDEIYVVDRGSRMLLRIDRFALREPAVVASLRDALSEVSLDRDSTVLVASRAAGEVLWLNRNGNRLAVVSAPLLAPVDAVMAGFPQSIWVADDGSGQLVGFSATGNEVRRLGEVGGMVLPTGLQALAPDGDGLLVLARNGEVYSVDPDLGRTTRRQGTVSLGADAVAADSCGRIYANGGDRGTVTVLAGSRTETVPVDLGEVTDLWYWRGELFVADGPGAEVAVYRVHPPCPW